MLTVRPAVDTDIKPYWEHFFRHEGESGRQGNLVFSPFENVPHRSLEEFSRTRLENWHKPLSKTGWERIWILADEFCVFGSLKLGQGLPIDSTLHRAFLCMGIERNYRGKGYGMELMNQALTWARAQSELSWIDLFVFEHNTPAKALYKKFGFVEVGTTIDKFRVFGKSVSDTTMVLKLR